MGDGVRWLSTGRVSQGSNGPREIVLERNARQSRKDLNVAIETELLKNERENLRGALRETEAQVRKVEAELKDAISALKKPNRTLAVKDFVEAADRRVSAGQLKSTSPTVSHRFRTRS